MADHSLWWIVTVLALALPSGCNHVQPPGPSATCLRHSVHYVRWNGQLERLIPSSSFNIEDHTIAWISTSTQRDQEDLSHLGGVASIAVIRAESSPTITVDAQGFHHAQDPQVGLDKANQWYRLPVSAGNWKIYTSSLGVSPLPVTIIGCPA